MRTPIAAGAVGILVLASGVVWAVDAYTDQQFRAELDRTLAALPAGVKASYKEAHYSAASRAGVVSGLTIHATLDGDKPLDVTIEQIETTNPNVDLANAWTKAAAAPTPDTVVAVADSVTIKGLSIHAPTVNTSSDLVRFDNPRVWPWALLHDGVPSWKELQAMLAPDATPPAGVDEMMPFLRAEAAAMIGIAYDGYEVAGMSFSQAMPEFDITYDVRKMAGGGFDRGVVRAGGAEGITFKGSKFGKVTVDRVSLGLTDVREPMTRILNGEALSQAMLNGITIGRIEYSGIAVEPPGQPPIRVSSISLGPLAFSQGMPIAGELGWKDIKVARAQLPDPSAREAFDKLKLDAVTVSFALAYDWDAAKGRARLHDTTLKVDELGTILVSAEVTDVGADLSTLDEAKLAHARVRFEDASLVDRVLGAGAAQANTKLDAFRKQMAEMVRQQSKAMGDNSKAMIAAGKAAGDFVTLPKSLTVELAPSEPVPVMSLMGAAAAPGETATALGLTVTANKP